MEEAVPHVEVRSDMQRYSWVLGRDDEKSLVVPIKAFAVVLTIESDFSKSRSNE